MTDHTIQSLVKTKQTILLQVERKDVSLKEAQSLLHLSRTGLWKLRRNYRKYGSLALTGRKRGPKGFNRVWNKTVESVEVKIVELYYQYGFGPDRLLWELEPLGIKLSRITVYRILVRRKALVPKIRGQRLPPKLYVKGYPGEEVQIDATEPFGKGRGWSLAGVDDFSRYADARLQVKNNSRLAGDFLKEIVGRFPFRIAAVRVDNGSEFKKDFVRMAGRLGIKIIRNPPNHPQSNGKVERFHRTLEEECYWRWGGRPDPVEATYQLNRYLAFYNERRRHQGLGMKKQTPKQRVEEYLNLEVFYQEENVYLTVIQYII